MEKPERLRKHDFGIVFLKDWIRNPNCNSPCNQLAGPIELIECKEAWGFQVRGNESNWGIRVGTDDSGVFILGCQLRSVYWGKSTNMKLLSSEIWDLRP